MSEPIWAASRDGLAIAVHHLAGHEPARRLLTGREARQLADRQRRYLGRRNLVESL